MHDSFTRMLPTYNHVQKSCYTTAASHYLHPQYKKDILYKPMTDIDRSHTHKHDFIKNYSESMYRLGVFAPQPIKGVFAAKKWKFISYL